MASAVIDDSSTLKLLIAHGIDDARDTLKMALQHLRYDQVDVCRTGQDLIAKTLEQPPDVIITGVDLPDIDGPSALIKISETHTIPAIVVTQRQSLEDVQRALEDHVMAYLIEPVRTEEILPTILLVLRRFEQFRELSQENENLRQALADRKVIERAKGLMMKRANIDEEAAYKRLRRFATDNRIKMVDAAERILAVDGLFEA